MKVQLINIAILFIVFFSCNTVNTERPKKMQVQYNNQLMKQLIGGFIKSVSQSSGHKYITIDLTVKDDTTTLALVNTFPDFQYANFQGIDTLKGYYLIFIGDVNEQFYKITGKYEAPKEILELSRRTYHGDYPPPSINPKQWVFNFSNDKLIEFSPKEDVEEHIQASFLKS